MTPQIAFLIDKALQNLTAGNFEVAKSHLNEALKIDPKNTHVLRFFGIIYAQQSDWSLAKNFFSQAISIDPKNGTAYSNLGNVFLELKQYEEAIKNYDQAITLEPRYAEAYSNKGNALSELKQYEEAIKNYDQAITLEPRYAEAYSNKGNALSELNRHQEALFSIDQAVRLNPNHAQAWLNGGKIFGELNVLDQSLQCYLKASELNSEFAFLNGLVLRIKETLGLWSNYQNDVDYLLKDLALNKHVAVPLALLSITDSPQDQLRSAQIWIDTKYPPNHFLGPIPKRSAGAKIKIAYFSADFREHPVAYLMAELFELHDRSCFEVYAFSLKQDASSPMRKRLQSAFDHFIEVDNKTDVEIAALARELQIDIAIDLGGHTQNARTGIFAYRAAPIQVNYLGFAGTMGASYMDYIVVDKITIPDEQAKYYLERKVYLPNSYMVDDSNRAPSNALFKRADFGLPEDGMVFCCFNNSYKFNPTRITSFAQILSAVPGSVLWVTENNPSFRENLLAQFNRLGIADARIVFATRIDPMEDHLARYRLADLFLDTSPYNAHTTAMDSLKAGVPIISLAGKSFASRVGASLLTAVGLPELITHDEQSFVDLAIKLGENIQELQSIKKRLASNLQDAPLFNARLFCKHLEMAYQYMYRNYLQDLPSADIHVPQS